MYKVLVKFDNKTAKLKLDNGKFIIAKINIVDENIVKLTTRSDEYYIHPSSVRFVRSYEE
tara:strand:- start:415 stop:594 length:180 start_codon:yes stop_codon:yes gene_type:complete